jgi:hypothetical protein
MAWFYNGKQMYGAWTNAQGEAQVATWDEDWTDAEKQQAGLISTGTVNTRFFEDDGETKKTVSTIKAEEEARMNGLKETILGETVADIINESDGEPVTTISGGIQARRDEAVASCTSAKSLIAAETTFDGLWDLLMNSKKLVHGIHVPDESGFWGTEHIETEVIHTRPPYGMTATKLPGRG